MKRLRQTFIQSVKTATPAYTFFSHKGASINDVIQKERIGVIKMGFGGNLQSMTWVTRERVQSFGNLSWRHLWMAPK